jgi:hypothetical protein
VIIEGHLLLRYILARIFDAESALEVILHSKATDDVALLFKKVLLLCRPFE